MGSKRFDIQVVEKLKEIRLAGNIEKSNKISPENMSNDLKICVENCDLEILHSHKLIIDNYIS